MCCVQPPSEPFLRLCRDVSRVVSVDLRCRSLPHLSPIRIKAFAPLGVRPLPLIADQKIFGSMPCPSVFGQISMVFNQPIDGSRHGRQRVRHAGSDWSKRPPKSDLVVLPTPCAGSPLTPTQQKAFEASPRRALGSEYIFIGGDRRGSKIVL